MKFLRLPLLVTIGLALSASVPEAWAAALTVTPSSVSNQYSGTITLTVTGLTNTELVLVEKFVDYNGNGAVDGGDTLIQSFKLTEGQVTRIGGVRNLNVPGDDDGVTNAAITTVLNFVDTFNFDHFVGKYLFRVSAPSSRFAPVLMPFTVTNTPFTPTITGNVPGGTYAAVVLLEQSGTDTELVAGAYTDAAGNFTLKHRPGTYQLLAVRPGSVTDFANSALANLTEGSSENFTVSVSASTRTISGQLLDSVSGDPLPGVTVQGMSTSDQFSLTQTDAAGNYSLAVSDGQWNIGPESDELARLGYLRLSVPGQHDGIPVVVSGGSVVTNLPQTKATALVYGSLRDGGNNPIPSIEIYANNGGSYSANGLTDAAGNYSIGVLPGMWNVSPSTETGLIVNGTNVTLSAGQAVPANFTTLAVTAHLRGQIRDSSGEPIPFVSIVVQPVPFLPGGAGSIYRMTDGNGDFDAGVFAGTWNINLECVQGQERNLVGVTTNNFTVTDGVDQNNLVLAFPRSTFTISGSVKDSLNNPVVGVQLDASAGNNTFLVGCIPTDANGNYTLKVINGSWSVTVRTDDLNMRGFTGVAGQTVNICGGNGTANFVVSPFANTPPTLSQPAYFGPGQFFFQATGEAGRNYALEFSTTLTNWTPILTNYFNSDVANTVADPSAPTTFRVYRLRLVP